MRLASSPCPWRLDLALGESEGSFVRSKTELAFHVAVALNRFVLLRSWLPGGRVLVERRVDPSEMVVLADWETAVDEASVVVVPACAAVAAAAVVPAVVAAFASDLVEVASYAWYALVDSDSDFDADSEMASTL